MASRQRRHNEHSILLMDSENKMIFESLGKGCYTLATAVVQLYLASPNQDQKWNKRYCGAACFVKDNPKKSYFIRVYDLKNKKMLWEQELCSHFKYKTPREYFHTFEADDCQVGLNFASEDEARIFRKIVETKLLEREKRRLAKKNNQNQELSQDAAGSPSINNTESETTTSEDVSSNNTSKISIKPKLSSSGRKTTTKKIVKADISSPLGFCHVTHVGLDSKVEFDTKQLEPEMRGLFQLIGVDDHSDVDKDTIELIYKYVEKHGGLQTVREELARCQTEAKSQPSFQDEVSTSPLPRPTVPHSKREGLEPSPPPERPLGTTLPPTPHRDRKISPPHPPLSGSPVVEAPSHSSPPHSGSSMPHVPPHRSTLPPPPYRDRKISSPHPPLLGDPAVEAPSPSSPPHNEAARLSVFPKSGSAIPHVPPNKSPHISFPPKSPPSGGSKLAPSPLNKTPTTSFQSKLPSQIESDIVSAPLNNVIDFSFPPPPPPEILSAVTSEPSNKSFDIPFPPPPTSVVPAPPPPFPSVASAPASQPIATLEENGSCDHRQHSGRNDGREFLNEIEKGFPLLPVGQRVERPVTPTPKGLIDDLIDALDRMRNALEFSDDDDDGSKIDDDDDEEWNNLVFS